MKSIYLLLLFPFLLNAQQEIHCKHFFKGYPLGTPASNDLIIRDLYALSNNDSTKFADWVAYKLTMHEVDGTLDLKREWRNDPWLDENETLEGKPNSADDYKNASSQFHYDRGHQAPLASFKGSRFASETDFYSNITPQKADLNQGPWARLEGKEREIVRSGKTVYVMTGPLYERNMDALPMADEPHTVPSGYWKIIVVMDGNSFNTASFIFDQDTPRSDDIIDHITNINVVEDRSGLDFFWEMEDTEEETLEDQIHQSWAETVFE